MIEGHGDDLHRYQGTIKHNFSSNVYHKGSPPELLEDLVARAAVIQNYPSPAASELSEAAGRRYDLPSHHFLFTNGATEAFYLIAHCFADKRAAIVSPTFSEYQDACHVHGLDYELIDKADLRPVADQIVFVCNPNNPDGSIIPTDELIRLIAGHPRTLFVIDEAYIEFTGQLTSLVPNVVQLQNLIVVRSLTKTFAIPGLRLGYVAAPIDTIEQLLHKKMPWSVNAIAIQAGLQLFTHYDQWQFNVKELLSETRQFMRDLSAIDGLQVLPTSTSYFLVKLAHGSASALKDYLGTQHGILIRDATNFKRLDGEYIRLATQSPEANAHLIKALKQWT